MCNWIEVSLMAYNIELIHGGTGIRLVGEGRLTGKEMLERASSISAKVPDLSRITHFIIDYSAVTDFDVSSGEMQSIAQNGKYVAEKIGHKIYSAVVAPSPLEYGMVRMYSALNDYPGLTVNIFISMVEAEDWLAKTISFEES